MDDLISRKWLMECVDEGWIKFDTEKDENRFIHLVRDIAPSVEPEQKRGKWIKHPEWQEDGECAYECDQCGMGSDVDYDFCMRCGADMRGEKDE